MTFIPPFDHPQVIAGQGTAGLELMSQEEGIGTVLVPCGGGGLLSGTALACRNENPACRVIGVEPELADDATRSFATKTLHRVDNPRTIADGTRTPCLGNLTFSLVLEHVSNMVTVSEQAIKDAVRFCLYQVKIVAEPSGVLGLAALLQGVVRPVGKTAVVISGGNVDDSVLAELLVSS
jgi:threonine dehydratase